MKQQLAGKKTKLKELINDALKQLTLKLQNYKKPTLLTLLDALLHKSIKFNYWFQIHFNKINWRKTSDKRARQEI